MFSNLFVGRNGALVYYYKVNYKLEILSQKKIWKGVCGL